jgi:hypothetical protein
LPAGRGNMSVTFQISGVTDPHEVARIAERRFRDLVRKMQSDQPGLLSDLTRGSPFGSMRSRAAFSA